MKFVNIQLLHVFCKFKKQFDTCSGESDDRATLIYMPIKTHRDIGNFSGPHKIN
jgi:hypothetical protein